MPHFECRDGKMLIRNNFHLVKLSSTFAKSFAKKQFTDVVVACKDGSLSAHAIVLAYGSMWMKHYFEVVMACGVVDEISLSCPDFSTFAMSKVMELLYTGVTYVDDLMAISEMKDIFQTLGFNYDITLNSSETETLKFCQTSVESLSNEKVKS